MVDCNDRHRVEVAREELTKLLASDELRNAVLLVYANKQDLPQSLTCAELSDKLGLHGIRDRPWYIQSTCAVTGEGLYEGLDWVCTQLRQPRSVAHR